MRTDAKSSEEGYDQDKIHSGSQDVHGHSATIRVPVPKPWLGLIDALERSALWPEYRSRQDFVRDALYHRLHWVRAQENRSLDPQTRELMLMAEMEAEAASLTLKSLGLSKLIETLDSSMTEVVMGQDHRAARRFIGEYRHRVDDEVVDPELAKKLHTQLDRWERRLAD